MEKSRAPPLPPQSHREFAVSTKSLAIRSTAGEHALRARISPNIFKHFPAESGWREKAENCRDANCSFLSPSSVTLIFSTRTAFFPPSPLLSLCYIHLCSCSETRVAKPLFRQGLLRSNAMGFLKNCKKTSAGPVLHAGSPTPGSSSKQREKCPKLIRAPSKPQAAELCEGRVWWGDICPAAEAEGCVGEHHKNRAQLLASPSGG